MLTRCDTCSSVHLTKDCEEKFQERLSRNRQTFICDPHIFSSVLLKAAVVCQNEDFIVYTYQIHLMLGIETIVLFN